MKTLSLIGRILIVFIALAIFVPSAHAAVLETIGQTSGTSTSPSNQGMGQSFTPTVSGYITSISVQPAGAGSFSTTLTIRVGAGTVNPPSYSQAVTLTRGALNTIPLSTPFSVNAGQIYTFHLVITTETYYYNTANVVPNGAFYNGGVQFPAIDWNFLVVISDSAVAPLTGGERPPDDRINWKHGDAYGVFVPRQDSQGNPVLHLYCVSTEGKGTLGDIVTWDVFKKAPVKPITNTLVGETTACRVPIRYYVLDTGEYQINIGPDWEGKVDVVIFTGLPPTKVYFYYLNWAPRY